MQILQGEKVNITDKLMLCRDEKGLYLTDGEQSLCPDFTRENKRLKEANLRGEMLVKAARIKGLESLTVLDATAGLGEDSILLAAAGFRVELYEYDAVIAALLRDALERAGKTDELAEIVSRMRLHEENSLEAMKKLDYKPDVVFLDPMFPERQKSALVKKKFQLLQQLERPCSEESELFEAALAAGPRKIVVKRPLKGPFLAGRKPDYSMPGKAIRYDCYLLT